MQRNISRFFLTIFILSSLAFSKISLAANETNLTTDLSSAIRQNKIEDVERLLKEGADPQNLDYFSRLPSLTLTTLLLENNQKPMNPSKFLGLIINCYYKDDDQFEANQKELIEIALKKGADPQNLDYFSNLPSPALTILLLENNQKPMNTSKFLGLVINCYYKDDDQFKIRQKELIEIVLKKGADLQNVTYFLKLPSLDLTELLLNKENPINLNKFLELIINCSNSNNDEQFEVKQEELITIALNRGADPKIINHFSKLPSLKLTNLLLENKRNPINPSRFFTLLMGCYNTNNDSQFEIKQMDLVKLALNKTTNLQTTIDFSKLPTIPSDFGNTWLDALLSAYCSLHFDIARLLLEKGVADDRSMTTMYLAKYEWAIPHLPFIHTIATTYLDSDKKIYTLLRSGSELSPYDANGLPLMCYAAINHDSESLIRMITMGFDVNIQDKLGNTPLMLAIISDDKNAIDLLLKNQANVNIINNLGMNVLHMLAYRYTFTHNTNNLELMISFITDYDANPNVVDSYGTKPLDHILQKFLSSLFSRLEGNNHIDYQSSPVLDNIFKEIQSSKTGKLSSLLLKDIDNHIYELILKKLKGESVQSFRKNTGDKNIYIGIAATVGYYSNTPFSLGTGIMAKHKDVRVKIFTPDMVNDEFIQQLDGLIVPGAGDNFPKEKKEFTLKNLNPDTMIPSEKLYQHVDRLADKYHIPTIGMCSGNQHIILYHQGTLMPVNNYVGDHSENKHQGIFIKGSIPHFLTLTPTEQRMALESCSLPKIILDIATAHHYAGVKGKLGDRLKLGAVSEEGVVESVYNGAHFIGVQFHPENFYSSSLTSPNRNRLIWENFLEICRQHHRYNTHAQEHNLDLRSTMKIRDEQNEVIITRLQECAQKDSPSTTESNSTDCAWFYQAAKRYNLNFQETMNSLLRKQQDQEEITKIQKCIQQEPLLEASSSIDNDESLPKRKDLCDHKKFQWSDYDLLDYKVVSSHENRTCEAS